MKGLMEFDYLEVDGLLYPEIEIDGEEILGALGEYGEMRLKYLHEHRPGLYREMLLNGRLATHCRSIDELGFKMAEQIREGYIKNHPVSDEDFWERVQVYTMAQQVADEVVLCELVYR